MWHAVALWWHLRESLTKGGVVVLTLVLGVVASVIAAQFIQRASVGSASPSIATAGESTTSSTVGTTTPEPPTSGETLKPTTRDVQEAPVFLDWVLEAGHDEKNVYGGWDYETYSSNGASYPLPS